MATQAIPSTCSICSTSFQNNDQQRAHAKSDWHVYNLKRRIAELPPLSSQAFSEKVAGVLETPNKTDIGLSRQRECVPCGTVYEDLKLYQRHLKSWQHVQRVEESEPGKNADEKVANLSLESVLLTEDQSDSEGESVASVVEHFNPSSCLFCTHNHASLDDSLQHMQKDHGMFVPDREHLVDLETFIGYLFTIISDFNECLHCGHIKSTSQGIRQHMLNKGHCKLRSREDAEYEEFYDDSDMHIESQKDEEVRTSEIAKLRNDTGHEVILQSGRTIADRSQVPSSRSDFRSHRKPAESQVVLASGGSTTKHSAEPQSSRGRQLITRADGGLGMIGVSDLQKRALRAVEKKMLNAEIRARNQYRAVVEKSANKTKQKHFKPDVPGRSNG